MSLPLHNNGEGERDTHLWTSGRQVHRRGKRRPAARNARYTKGVAFLIGKNSDDFGLSRSSRFRSPTRGVRVEAQAQGWWDDLSALALALPQAAFSHTTAAHIAGLPLPTRDPRPFHVSVDGPRGSRKAVVWHQRAVLEAEHHRGYLITTPLRTWLDLGCLLSVRDLVVVADHLLRRGLMAPDPVIPPVVGSRRLRQAADLADGRSKSPQETRIRLEMRDRGFPPPELNAPIIEDGGWIGEGDFVWREYRTITDYDGAVHLDEKKHTQDNQTRDLYAAHGWRHVALTKRMVRNMDAALERVARALRDNGWLG